MMQSESTANGSAISEALDLGAGFLAGVVKGNFDIAGLPTTMGSRAFANAGPAPRHAEVVERLIAGRYRITGRAKMHELAFGVSGINAWQGTPLNPNFPDLIPGGSSSGSACAVASGSVDFALGTDTGGSIREPAACCGVIGFKPTFGRVSHMGVHPANSSLDCVGIFAREVAVIEQVAAIIDPAFVSCSLAAIKTIGIVETEADPEVSEAFLKAIAQTGLKAIKITLPSMNEAFKAGMTVIGAEMWQAFRERPELFDDMGKDVAARLRAAASIMPTDVDQAEQVRTRFCAEIDQALEGVDILAMPTLPQVPPLLKEAGVSQNLLRLTQNVRPFNLSGHPAISLALLTATGLPAGLQLVAGKDQDAHLCAIARQFEAAFIQDESQAA